MKMASCQLLLKFFMLPRIVCWLDHLGLYFKVGAEGFLNLQQIYDLEIWKDRQEAVVKKIIRPYQETRIYIDKIEWKETTKTKNNEKKERIYLYKKHKEKTYKKKRVQKTRIHTKAPVQKHPQVTPYFHHYMQTPI